jgi:NADPH2 dehydrogenase
MAKLFKNFELKGKLIKNRIVMAPMCMYSAENDGIANSFHLTHYTSRAIGGVGTIIIESTSVEPRGRISVNDLGLWSDDHIPMLKKIVENVHEYNTFIGIQINHAGRKAVTNEKNIAPSLTSDYSENIEMDKDTIKKTVMLFKEAAQRAKEAGFDFIEIHAAHGYLINQFLSPLSNKRTDEYGGSIENSARFLKEIVTEIRSVWTNDLPLYIRFSAEDYDKDGNHPADIGNIINLIKDNIDVVDVSSGGIVRAAPPIYPGYQIGFAKAIREITGLPVIGGGLITTAEMAEAEVSSGIVDFVFFGRELLRNPYFPLNAAKELNEEIEWPQQYRRAKK